MSKPVHRSLVAALALAAGLSAAGSAAATSASAVIPVVSAYSINVSIFNSSSSTLYLTATLEQLDAQTWSGCGSNPGVKTSVMDTVNPTWTCVLTIPAGDTAWISVDPAYLDSYTEQVRITTAFSATMNPTIVAAVYNSVSGHVEQWELNHH